MILILFLLSRPFCPHGELGCRPQAKNDRIRDVVVFLLCSGQVESSSFLFENLGSKWLLLLMYRHRSICCDHHAASPLLVYFVTIRFLVGMTKENSHSGAFYLICIFESNNRDKCGCVCIFPSSGRGAI